MWIDGRCGLTVIEGVGWCSEVVVRVKCTAVKLNDSIVQCGDF